MGLGFSLLKLISCLFIYLKLVLFIKLVFNIKKNSVELIIISYF